MQARTTFWVAYGPVADRFHIVQLHRSQPGLYSAARMLPVGERTTFTYLSGRGVVQTRMGPVPGDPVVTIRTTGPMTISAHQLPTVRWVAPVG